MKLMMKNTHSERTEFSTETYGVRNLWKSQLSFHIVCPCTRQVKMCFEVNQIHNIVLREYTFLIVVTNMTTKLTN